MNNFTKRCVAAFASLAMAGTLCAAGAVTVSSVAWGANTGKTPPNQGGNPSQAAQPGKAPWELTADEKTSTTGSITINKWEDEVEGGKQKKSTPVEGAEFTVKKATNIDLTKYSDWVNIANKISDFNEGKENPGGITFESNGTTKNTSGTDQGTQKGVAKFDKLGIGLYQVQETKVPKGYSASESKPFYMTIPMIEKGDGGKVVYNYNPSADPKNKNLKKCVKKTADTSETIGAGDKIKYTISAELDKMKETGATALTADDFNGYSVVDLAPAKAFTAYTADVVKKVTLGTGEKPVDTDTKLETTDYTVTPDTPADGATERKITISFTPTGQGKLAAEANKPANAGKTVKVFVALEFTLTSKSADLGTSVTNKGGLIPSHGDGDNPDVVTGEDNEKVEFSKFKITKVSATNTSTKLPNAKFKLFADKTNAEKCSKAIASNSGVENACAAASKGFGEQETGTTGETTEYSLVYKQGRKLYLVETVAPTGYIRNPDAVEFTVSQTTTNVPFQNLPNKDNGFWFNLPKTGAAGVILFALAGVCFVGAGFVVYIHRRKKEEEQAKLRA
ncbi:SpaH/EbpB family LPXTG-anchored major pilin [Gardnerella greenwoodii]|uniref:SpaH/EbpB family LPXTG-anchored major pilin n=1 Tax=Gardnerella greenwoodii TaxID=2914925 RepID=UPI0039EFF964